MKVAAAFVTVLFAFAGTGCEEQKNTKLSPIAPSDFKLQQAQGGGGGGGDLEARVAQLESYTEELDFLREVYASQPKKPAKDLCAAVDISEDLRIGQVEGPITAPITIVEAWDFA